MLVRLVLHSKDRSNLGVSQRMPEPMILSKVLPFQRRIQVLELNADSTLAQKVLFSQVVVNLVLGLVQVILIIIFFIVPTFLVVIMVVVVVTIVLAIT